VDIKSLFGCIERFRDIAYFTKGKLRLENLKLRCEWSAERDIVPTCEIVQMFRDGEEITLAEGDGEDACNEAVNSFEEILKRK